MLNIDKKMPAQYHTIIEQADYEHLINIVIDTLTRFGIKINRCKAGVFYLSLQNDERELQAGLDNLIKSVHKVERENWLKVVESHFARLSKFKEQEKAYNFFFKDFEYAQQYLRLLVKDEDALPANLSQDLVQRVDFPGTITILVFDFDDQFRFLTTGDIQEWEVSAFELFEIAQQNVNREAIEVQEMIWNEKYPIYAFFSGDFAVSYLLDFEKNAEFGIGEFGALLAIPTKGAAFVHPIQDENVLKIIETIHPLVDQFYTNEPGCINQHYYWYYQGKLETFPTTKSTIQLPQELARLFKNMLG
jgi:hypothetical protein